MLAFGAAAVSAWGMGLSWFAGEMPLAAPADMQPIDAVVVLTGGSRRLGAGLEILARGDAKKLLVSGVHPDVVKAEIAGADRRLQVLAECCLELGYEATDTVGNAQEAARWMRRETFTSLALVTATYHMPRSLAEFRQALPDAHIVAYPVFPDNFKREEWWRWPGSAALVLAEYHKYMLARLRFGLAEIVGARVDAEALS
ncbi:MAG: YdcF family protein [Alphaproteobacteria bacterium]|nr:YdcF family protein [Alphaproteobacteria bacterium]